MDREDAVIELPPMDADGFLLDPQRWDEALARRLAQLDGLGELSGDQLELLECLREQYFRSGGLPALPHVCHLKGRSPVCLNELFPSAREAWRLAGLPNPGEEAKAYM
ncbi:MAG: TusE/DsrC/DsvC family sulfur relay protein [Thiobacillaceae bacterium]|nr:TusE/DsrC/DsvC family sulfur relay protein [Thiobacillaceae bacterium]MCX7672516.1 TusE/DsrC/DsvC family sulfur relay protein [Thiobacillaceae bacterium]MDW8324721.1 TusE/DsrC/DsvC family sulfur relay protein [Burkholderiales bacterium]